MLQRQHLPDISILHINMTRIAADPFLQSILIRDGLFTVPDSFGTGVKRSLLQVSFVRLPVIQQKISVFS
ncbi:MAG: hypothetical protein JXA44_09450 [Methanospirillaceae archaeon]|nr:hypothetical protein [Methanospirillaceae archaeon]